MKVNDKEAQFDFRSRMNHCINVGRLEDNVPAQNELSPLLILDKQILDENEESLSV